LYGAKKSDVEGLLKFDEGPDLKNQKSTLRKRKIQVKGSIQRIEAIGVLRLYKELNGIIY